MNNTAYTIHWFKNKHLLFVVSAFFIFFLVLIPTSTAHATPIVGFNPARIIDDGIFTNSNTLNVAQIQAFLNSKVSSCDTNGTQPASDFGRPDLTHAQYAALMGWSAPPYTCLKDYSENNLSAAQIIYNTAQQFQINPEVLIVLLQKEQGLVTDTWPLATQYRTATGYGCPDTTVCNTVYYGFTNQLHWSGTMFRAILDNNPNWYTPYLLGNNYIRWQQDSWNSSTSSWQNVCGGTTVDIQNRATQALYNYTPYQPNAASLAAGYGTGDSCSSYGNRNFFAYFTDWFGPTLSNVSLQKGTSSNTVYVVYDGKKQGIPSPDILSAWGLSGLPVYTVSDVAISAIPDGGILTRLVKNPYNPSMLLLADNGGFFNAWPNTITNFGLDPTTASTISPSLLSMTSRSANLSPFIETPSVGGVLLVDKGTYHSFSSLDSLVSWAGSAPTTSTISSALFSSILTANPTYGVYSGQLADSVGNRYLVDNGATHPLIGSLKVNYPQDKQLTVDTALINLLPKATALTPFVQSVSGNTIYLLDGGKKLGFTSGDVFSSFISSNHLGAVTYLSQSAVDSVAYGPAISSRFIYNSTTPSANYYVNGSAIPLTAPFAANNYGLALSPDTIGDLSVSASAISCGDGTGFIQAQGAATVYMIENGTRRPITNPRDFYLLDTSGAICTLPPADANTIPDGPIVTPFVQYNGGYYLLEASKRYTTDLSTLANFGVSSPVQITSQIFSTYADGGTLALSFTANGNSYLVRNGIYYSTSSAAISQLWGIGAQAHTAWLAQGLVNGGSLDQYARSSDTSNGTIYLVDSGTFYGITDINSFMNSGASGKNIATIDAAYIAAHSSASIWQGYLAKDSTGIVWVLDNGTKRKISSVAQADWVGTQIPTLLSDAYLSLLPQGPDLTYSISATGSYTIYGLDTGTKRGITALSKYVGTKYSPSSSVSNYLLNDIPTGPNI
jgi:hypothetical protein